MLIEAYLIDFEGDLYGAELTLEFVEYLRPELAFEGVEPLVAQMAEDVATSREVLAGVAVPNMRLDTGAVTVANAPPHHFRFYAQ